MHTDGYTYDSNKYINILGVCFAGDDENIPDKKEDFIIIDESEIGLMREFLSQTDWDFPASYKRTDLGTDGHILTKMGFNYNLQHYLDT